MKHSSVDVVDIHKSYNEMQPMMHQRRDIAYISQISSRVVPHQRYASVHVQYYRNDFEQLWHAHSRASDIIELLDLSTPMIYTRS